MPQNLFDNSGSGNAETQTGSELAAADRQDAVSTEPYLTKVTARPVMPGVIFLLGFRGHIRAGYSEKEASGLYDDTEAYARWAKANDNGGLDLETFSFQSLNQLIEIRPERYPKKKWYGAILVTHSLSDAPEQQPDEIFFGDASYTVGDLLEFAYDLVNRARVTTFRRHFDENSPLTIIACGAGRHSADLGIYLREFFGVRGQVTLPKVHVEIDKNTGMPMAPISKGSKKLRSLRLDEWLVIPPKP